VPPLHQLSRDRPLVFRYGDEWSPGEPQLSLESGGYLRSTTRAEEDLDFHIEKVRQAIRRRNATVQSGNVDLEQHIRTTLQRRMNSIQDKRELLERITKKTKVPLTIVDKAERKVPTSFALDERVIPLRPQAQTPQRSVLSRDQFETIFDLVDGSCQQFERTPAGFTKLNEEELRNVILSNLNQVTRGQAQGEAFSKRGKTDILLRVPEGGLFITECKNWTGKKGFVAAIEQVLGYLTWREAYGVVAFFIRSRNFSEVLTTIKNAIPQLPNYVGNLREHQPNRFELRAALPGDVGCHVSLTVVAYSLYIEKREPKILEGGYPQSDNSSLPEGA